jgi:hypothetical protein
VIAVSDLRDRLDNEEGWLMFGADGSRMDMAVPDEIGPAGLLVRSVTDAVKTLASDGRVDGSLDRESIWAVEGFVLSETLIRSLPELDLTAEALLEAVVELGMEWDVRVVGPDLA